MLCYVRPLLSVLIKQPARFKPTGSGGRRIRQKTLSPEQSRPIFDDGSRNTRAVAFM
ncbi:MAG: hypothetical protein H0T63_07970 [Pyrinomonadaceae bacterium]|nr:hypothetical protein [Pyrinomonadaceae bacterium]